MGRPKPVAVDLLADLSPDVDAVPTQSMPPPKPKRTKRAQPKAKVTQVESEDALPICKLAESKKTSSAPAKRSAENPPSGSTQSKKPRSASATTSRSKKPDVPWALKITLEDRPIMSSENADDINVGVALSTALLLPGDLERNAEYSEYENYALMLQHSVQAIQHAHSFSTQAFENRAKLVDLKREVSALKKENKSLQLKIKKLEDQAEAATKAQTLAEEKAESAEAIRKIAEAEKREDEDKKAQAKKELQDALSTKDAEIKAADEKAYAQGMADVTREYKLQVRQNEQVLDLTHEEDEDVIKETTPEQASSDVPPVDKSLDQTLAEIDAEIAADEEAEVSLQETSEVQIQPDADVEKS
ncbi:plectin-like [Camellia sinensis]|uniref:plectin-like n=1 Tax=Camellia sinensis TaxID=4442 RepID=UPI001036B4EB|nr:plectin-like [Camellia sinensis]